MTWVRVRFYVPPDKQDIALAFLSDSPFSAFEEKEEWLDAYALEKEWTPEWERSYREGDHWPWRFFEVTALPDENWNLKWEQHFDPVILRPFCAVRAPFHAAIGDVRYEIVILPAMAFGTGHHATTKMMLQGMQGLEWHGKRVLDFGAGTGVLAILAAMMGADSVDAVEVEAPACESALGNVIRNGVEDRVRILHGDANAIPDRRYDFILANINTHIILQDARTLWEHLTPGGILGISGFLDRDRDTMINAMEGMGLRMLHAFRESDWLAQWWHKPE
ncbi:MAG: 50S ribosomal protein L11 methyltransferase [Saprospiraceae bacterium]|nr:50S ribosomal protein L11 methyltransferase [Saprospiraceae bacterium]